MAQHEDLQLLRALAPTKQHDQLEHAADDHVHQRPEQTHLQGREDRRYLRAASKTAPNLPIEYVHRTRYRRIRAKDGLCLGCSSFCAAYPAPRRGGVDGAYSLCTGRVWLGAVSPWRWWALTPPFTRSGDGEGTRRAGHGRLRRGESVGVNLPEDQVGKHPPLLMMVKLPMYQSWLDPPGAKDLCSEYLYEMPFGHNHRA
jgi:hypothetical protein